MQSLADIFIPSCNKARRKQGLFSFVEGIRENYTKRVEKSSSSSNQCRYADGEEYRMIKWSRVSTAENIQFHCSLDFHWL